MLPSFLKATACSSAEVIVRKFYYLGRYLLGTGRWYINPAATEKNEGVIGVNDTYLEIVLAKKETPWNN